MKKIYEEPTLTIIEIQNDEIVMGESGEVAWWETTPGSGSDA